MTANTFLSGHHLAGSTLTPRCAVNPTSRNTKFFDDFAFVCDDLASFTVLFLLGFESVRY